MFWYQYVLGILNLIHKVFNFTTQYKKIYESIILSGYLISTIALTNNIKIIEI